MYKMAVFDIDGTLTMRRDEVPESTLETIDRLRKRGIHCLMATGRGKVAIENLAEITGIRNYVALNGQYVFYDNEVTYKYNYPKNVIDRVIEICNEIDCHYGLISERGYYIPDMEDLLKIHKSSILRSKITIDSLREGEEVNQIIVFCEAEKHVYFEELKKDYAFTRWHSGGFDMHVNTRSKVQGIKEIAEMLNIEKNEIICFGDGDNDIEMLEFAGMGVAMGNASERAKGAADYTTEAVDKDGIYNACRKLGVL